MKMAAREVLLVALACLLMVPAIFSVEANGEPAKQEEGTVLIRPNYVDVPLGRILLVKKQKEYCAIRYIEFWKDKKGYYARYESFYQGDGTGDFTKENVAYINAKVSNLGLHNFLGSHYWKGDLDLQCGPIRLLFGGGEKAGGAAFFGSTQPQKDHGIELAPTPWTTIPEINVSDPRIVWYRFNSRRPDRIVPIGKLWGGFGDAS